MAGRPTSRSNHASDAFINVRPLGRPSFRPSARPHLIRRTRCQGDRHPGRESSGHPRRPKRDRLGGARGPPGVRSSSSRGCDGRTFVTISLISGVARGRRSSRNIDPPPAARRRLARSSSNLLISRQWRRARARRKIRFVVARVNDVSLLRHQFYGDEGLRRTTDRTAGLLHCALKHSLLQAFSPAFLSTHAPFVLLPASIFAFV